MVDFVPPATMFTHLHVHTEYSLLDGISRIPKLVEQASALGMDALAITDHGSLYGAVNFYSAAQSMDVKPIIGCEIYEAHNDRNVKDGSEKSPFHLTVLAQNNTGYKNLIQLVSKAHLEGFYYRPRVDDELLEQHSEGLIVLSGCPSAKVPKLITQGQVEDAAARARWYKELFDGRFYLEVQEHANIPGLPTINKALVSMGTELDIPLVATNDSHYTHQGDAHLQDLRICIHTNTTIHDESRLKMDDDSFYLKSPQEMASLFTELPEAISNTQRIAESCQVSLEFGNLHLPSYPVPDDGDADEFLTKLCWEGLHRLYPSPAPEVVDRLKYELEVIRQTRFANYFLVVWEIVSFARQNRILLAVRGSAAASLALYCLGVTEVDPLEHKLVFERFLNLERKEMPDIDMDFQDDRREEILNYVTHRYGKDKVAQIITFGTLGPKAAIRDVGKALGMGFADTDRIARLIPFKVRDLREAVEVTPQIREMYDGDEAIKNLIEKSIGLEGIPHHVSTHAAGVVISEDPLTEYVPLQRPARGGDTSEVAMTQFAMDPIAKLGLLKMDFLGLTNLTILDKTLKMLKQTQGLSLDLQDIPLDDKKTFQLLSSGKTNEVFQLESAGMQRNIKELKPSSLSDIAAMIALYRPGPMEQIPTFIEAKHGRSPVKSPHPSLDEILKDSYGVIVFQDQVLLLLQTFAGYSLGEADIVRKAMGKKIPSLMKQERERFISGAQEKGFSEAQAQGVFNLIEPFAGYAFNKAHSVSYAQISYWTAYFKANYSLEYMASVLNARRDQPEKMNNAANECLRMGIPILAPDVNRSDVDFVIDRDQQEQQSIRFGLAAIKNLGESAVTSLVQQRKESGAYKSLADFVRRADLQGLNRRGLESMIKVGTFDCLGKRGAVLNVTNSILAQSQMEARIRETGQTSLFQSESSVQEDYPMVGFSLEDQDATLSEKVAWEKDLLGVSLTSNPLKNMLANIPSHVIATLEQMDTGMEGQQVTVLGQLSSARQRSTRDQRQYLTASLELLDGSLEVIAWPQVLERTSGQWQEGLILEVDGKVVVRGEDMSIYCSAVREYKVNSKSNGKAKSRRRSNSPNGTSTNGHVVNGSQDAPQNCTLLLTMEESTDQEKDTQLLQNAVEALLEYPGEDKVHLNILSPSKQVRIDMPFTVKFCLELEGKLEDLLGPDKISVTAMTNGNGNGNG